jgi:hypothetical protein
MCCRYWRVNKKMNSPKQSLAAATGRECWVSTLQLAMQEVFDLMLACPLEVPASPPPEEGLDITAMVGLAGQLCGVLTVRCSAKSATHMASRMLGTDPEKAGPEVWDAMPVNEEYRTVLLFEGSTVVLCLECS